MRILKKKIQRALANAQANDQGIHTQEVQNSKIAIDSPSSKSEPIIPRGLTSSKNIMKNYARAFVTFATSSMAIPYLGPILVKCELNLKEFQDFLQQRKEMIHCIKSVRELLIIKEGEDQKLSAIKIVFKEICIVFLKFFSVNWVFSSRVCDKISHLNCRMKILRRVRNPMYFTYLREFAKAPAHKRKRTL